MVFRRFLLNLVRIFGNNSQFLQFFGSFGIIRDPLVDCERILKNSWDLLVDFGKILWKLLETALQILGSLWVLVDFLGSFEGFSKDCLGATLNYGILMGSKGYLGSFGGFGQYPYGF